MDAWDGKLGQVGVEGTGAYGAGLARYLHDQGIDVLEVPRPDRRIRRQRGKSDPIDAEAAARTVLAGKASGAPKLADGPIEAIRMLRVARNGAVKARTAALNTLRSMVITAPEPLRTQLRSLSSAQLVAACARLRPDLANLAEPVQATKHALRSIALRVQHLDTETRALRKQLDELTQAAAPATSAVFGLGPDTVSALLITVGDNPDRLRSEAAFAHLCGVAPIPASSGKTNRHRLHRGGDRAGNSALHIAAVVRLRYDPRSRAYADRRTTGACRCLKYPLPEALPRPRNLSRTTRRLRQTQHLTSIGASLATSRKASFSSSASASSRFSWVFCSRSSLSSFAASRSIPP